MRMTSDLEARFAIEREQERFDWEMMVFIRFWADVDAWNRRRALTILQKGIGRLVSVSGENGSGGGGDEP